MRVFRRLCTGQLAAYQFIDKIVDAAEAAEWAAALRVLLEDRLDAGDGRLWSSLWAAEFRALPTAAYPRERERVAADIRRIEPLAASGEREILTALYDGYKLSAMPAQPPGFSDASTRTGRCRRNTRPGSG